MEEEPKQKSIFEEFSSKPQQNLDSDLSRKRKAVFNFTVN